MSGETKTHVGTCSATEQKPGSDWIKFMIDVPGNKYPVRASTRDEEIIEKAKAVGANVATWTVNEVESDKINPRNNRPYINVYLEDVVAGGVMAPENSQNANGSPTAGAQDGMTQEKWEAKERRDYRSRAWAQVLSTFEHTIKTDEDPLEAVKRLQAAQRYVFEDVCGTFAYPEDESDIPF